MFRNLKLESTDDFKAVLYKNFREELCEIPSEFINSIEYKLKDFSTLTCTIPNKVTHNGKTIDNPIYNKFKPKRFIIVNNEERFIISNMKINSNKDIKKKQIEAKSFEYDLAKKDITVLDGVYQLYKDKNDTVNIEKGVLNWLEDETSWEIGYIDQDAKKSNGLFDEEITVKLYDDLKLKYLQNDTIIMDKDININIGENALNFNINYNEIKSSDVKSNVSKTENQIHKFEKFAQPIKHIKATYGVDNSYNTVISYEFTLLDGYVQKIRKQFTYLQNLDVEFKNITLTHNTGKKVEQSKVKYRSMDRNTHQWISFLREIVEVAFDCICQFDTVNKIVNVYDRRNLGEDKGFYLYYDQYLMGVEEDLKVDNVITRLVVEGKDGLGISGVNPLGTNYVEDFTYLLEQGNISEELQLALGRYNKVTVEQFKLWKAAKDSKEKNSKNAVYLEAKIKELQEKIKAKNAIKIGFIKMGEQLNESQREEYDKLESDLKTLNEGLDKLLKELTTLKDTIKSLDIEMGKHCLSLDKTKVEDENGIIFTQDDLRELDECIYSEKQNDDYYTDEQELYDNAKRVLAERNKIPINFTTTVQGITRHPRGWRDMIRLGNIAYIVGKDNNRITNDYVKVIGIQYTPPKNNLSSKIENIEFSNIDYDTHDLKTIRNISVRKINYSKANISYWKHTWIDNNIKNKFINNLNNGIDTDTIPIIATNITNKMDITGSGMWFSDNEDGTNKKQVYLGSGFMAVTNDNWLTSRKLTDENGIIAQSIFGVGILGERMNLANVKDTFRIDDKGITVRDNEGKIKVRLGLYEVNGETKSSLLMYNKDGKIIISEDGMSQINTINKTDNVDKTHPINIPFYLDETVKEIRKVKIFIGLSKYRSSVKTNVDEYGFSSSGGFLSFYSNDIDLGFEESSVKYGIKETTLPTNVAIIVNDVTVIQGINEDAHVDITEHIKINKLNKIKIMSETNGRIDISIFTNAFIDV